MALCLSVLKKHDRHRASFYFWAQAQPKNGADILYNRRACSALQGIGGRATNKQRAKCKTFALLASVISNLKRHNAFDQHGCLSQYRRALCPIYRCNCSRNVMASFTVEKVLHCLHSHWLLSSVSSSPSRPSESEPKKRQIRIRFSERLVSAGFLYSFLVDL